MRIQWPPKWEEETLDDNTKITVCDKCLCASCWQGIFMCQEAQHAGIVQKTVGELKRLNREHPCYWKTDEELTS